MISITPPDYNEICQRWHQATVANNYLKWRAISSWLAAVSIMCNVDGMPEAGESVRVASDLAMQHALDIQPAQEMEAA